MFTGQEQYFFEGVVIVYYCTNSIVWFGAMMHYFLNVCQSLVRYFPRELTTVVYTFICADHHEIHIFIISSSSSQFPMYITNQSNNQLPVGFMAQLVSVLRRYHRGSSLLLYLHFAVPIYEFHLLIFSWHLVFQILHCLITRLLEGRLFNMKNYDQPSMGFSQKFS